MPLPNREKKPRIKIEYVSSMPTLEPNKVFPADVKGWLKEAARLNRQGFWWYTLCLALYFALTEFFRQAFLPLALFLPKWLLVFSAVMFYMGAISLATLPLVLVSAYADGQPNPVSPQGLRQAVGPCVGFVWTAIANAAVFFLLAAPLIWWLARSSPPEAVQGSINIAWKWLLIHVAWLMTLWALLDLKKVLFCVPLILFHGLSWIDAKRLSHHAQRLNARALRRLRFPVYLPMFVAYAFPFLVVPMIPWIGALIYVVYRHVFLGRKENASVLHTQHAQRHLTQHT
jgi:hypothetical protein